MAKDPLYLPKGSIRSILTFVLILCPIISWFVLREIPSDIKDMAMMVVGYYFGFRTANKNKEDN